MTKLKLSYWPIRGLVQRIKLVLQYCGLQYQFQVTNMDNWFSKDKPQLHQKNPFINLPYLIDGDKIISQSSAIMVYCVYKAGKTSLLGQNMQDRVNVDAFIGFFGDLYNQYNKFCYKKSQDYQKDKTQLKQNLDRRMQKVQKILSKQEFVACKHITLGDILFYDWCSIYEQVLYKGQLKAFKNISEFYKRIGSIQNIKKYRQSDRFKIQPINGPPAQFSPLK